MYQMNQTKSQFESYKAAKELMEKDLEGYEMIDALSDYSFYEKGVVSQPVCALDHIQPFLEKRPEKLWGYYCTAQYLDVSNRFIVQPGYRTRILGAQMYKYQLNGFLHWGYNFYNAEHSIFPIDLIVVRMQQEHFHRGIHSWYIRVKMVIRKSLSV